VRLTSYRPTVPLPVPSPVPATEPLAELAGVVEIDAEVLPALDLRVMMAMPAAVDDWTAMIVVAGPDGRWALAVDRIDRLVVVPEAALRPAGAAVHPLVSHIVRVGDRLVSLLDLAPLFRV
jgi:chemotaxis signal transduction protein